VVVSVTRVQGWHDGIYAAAPDTASEMCNDGPRSCSILCRIPQHGGLSQLHIGCHPVRNSSQPPLGCSVSASCGVGDWHRLAAPRCQAARAPGRYETTRGSETISQSPRYGLDSSARVAVERVVRNGAAPLDCRRFHWAGKYRAFPMGSHISCTLLWYVLVRYLDSPSDLQRGSYNGVRELLASAELQASS